MSRNFPLHNSQQWAVWHEKSGFFLGRFCWGQGNHYGPVIPTFSSKKACKEAISRLTCYKYEVRPMRVSVTVMRLEHSS